MSDKKIKKLQEYLRQGKVICGTHDCLSEEGRILTTMVCVRKNDEHFEVDIESFFADVDIRELNIRDDIKNFSNLEEAINFIKNETNINFVEMHAS